jgi:hypothetical protein
MFALNNSVSDSIGCTPALLTFGFHPKTPHSQAVEIMLAGDTAGRSPAAYEFVDTMYRNFIIAKKCLAKAQDKMRAARDGKQIDLILQPDQLVLLRTTNLTMPGKRKFLPRFVDPFPVIRPIGVNAYQIRLPDTWKIHDVFNVSLLKAYVARKGYVPIPARPPEDDFSYIPESIVAHEELPSKHPNTQIHYKYRVHYERTSSEEDTWEFDSDLLHFYFPMLQQYHDKHELHELTQPPPFHTEPVRGSGSRRVG